MSLKSDEQLEKCFQSAVDFAKNRKHEYVTVEHLFYAILTNEDFGEKLIEYDIDIASLLKDLLEYLETKDKARAVLDAASIVLGNKL